MRVFLFKNVFIYIFSTKCLPIQFLTETLDRSIEAASTRCKRNLKTQIYFYGWATLISHENWASRKRTSNRRNWKRRIFVFVWTKHYENRASVTVIMWFPWQRAILKWRMIAAFLNSCGVSWTRGALGPHRNVMHVITVLPRECKRATPCYLHC